MKVCGISCHVLIYSILGQIPTSFDCILPGFHHPRRKVFSFSPTHVSVSVLSDAKCDDSPDTKNFTAGGMVAVVMIVDFEVAVVVVIATIEATVVGGVFVHVHC